MKIDLTHNEKETLQKNGIIYKVTGTAPSDIGELISWIDDHAEELQIGRSPFKDCWLVTIANADKINVLPECYSANHLTGALFDVAMDIRKGMTLYGGADEQIKE